MIGQGRFRPIARPRGGDWLEVDLRRFQEQGVNIVVSLLTHPEVQELSLHDEQDLCEGLGLKFYSFPITDRGLPKDREAFLNLAADLKRAIESGAQAVFHCRAGLGRAPLLGCAVLSHSGLEPSDCWALLESCRGQKVPDTEEQKHWLNDSQDPQRGLHRSLDEIIESLEP